MQGKNEKEKNEKVISYLYFKWFRASTLWLNSNVTNRYKVKQKFPIFTFKTLPSPYSRIASAGNGNAQVTTLIMPSAR